MIAGGSTTPFGVVEGSGGALVRGVRSVDGEGEALSYEQEQMWVLYQLDRCSAAYNVPHVQWLSGDLKFEKLVDAVRSVAECHEILRMRYGSDGSGDGRQWLVPAEDWSLPVFEMWADDKEDAERFVSEEIGCAMELEVCSVRLLVVHTQLWV